MPRDGERFISCEELSRVSPETAMRLGCYVPPKPPPDERLVSYVFPLRHGVLVPVRLPPDLTPHEAARLGAWLASLPLPEKDETPQSDARGDHPAVVTTTS